MPVPRHPKREAFIIMNPISTIEPVSNTAATVEASSGGFGVETSPVDTLGAVAPALERVADEAQAGVSFPNDRRKRNIPVATDRRRAANAAKARENSGRRRLIDPTTCERDYSDEETDFMKAMDRYKRDNRRPFPTWSEVLEVMRSLGYRRVAEPTDLPGAKKFIAE